MEVRAGICAITTKPPKNRCVKLEEWEGTRRIGISIDEPSSLYLLSALKHIEITTPSPHEAMVNCLRAIKGSIEKVVIYDLAKIPAGDEIHNTYKANIFIKDEREDKVYFLDINSVDAVIAATIAGCPIFIGEDVFAKANEDTQKADAQRDFETLDIKKSTKM